MIHILSYVFKRSALFPHICSWYSEPPGRMDRGELLDLDPLQLNLTLGETQNNGDCNGGERILIPLPIIENIIISLSTDQ